MSPHLDDSNWLFPRLAHFKTRICSLNVVIDLVNQFWRLKDFNVFSLLDFSIGLFHYLFIYLLKLKSFSHYLHVIKTCYRFIARWTKKTEPVHCFLKNNPNAIIYLWFCSPTLPCFLHICQFAFTSSDSNFIPFWLNSRYFLPSIFFSLFYYLNSTVVYLNIKWVFARRVFVKMPKCFALFFIFFF